MHYSRNNLPCRQLAAPPGIWGVIWLSCFSSHCSTTHWTGTRCMNKQITTCACISLAERAMGGTFLYAILSLCAARKVTSPGSPTHGCARRALVHTRILHIYSACGMNETSGRAEGARARPTAPAHYGDRARAARWIGRDFIVADKSCTRRII